MTFHSSPGTDSTKLKGIRGEIAIPKDMAHKKIRGGKRGGTDGKKRTVGLDGGNNCGVLEAQVTR